ncbi:hypothetical protein Q9966_007675 [Columba livia]|nr:hypothetical protein Q9966_007675 [Columba livia]
MFSVRSLGLSWQSDSCCLLLGFHEDKQLKCGQLIYSLVVVVIWNLLLPPPGSWCHVGC